jgi:hypothetical protein
MLSGEDVTGAVCKTRCQTECIGMKERERCGTSFLSSACYSLHLSLSRCVCNTHRLSLSLCNG